MPGVNRVDKRARCRNGEVTSRHQKRPKVAGGVVDAAENITEYQQPSDQGRSGE